MTVSDAQYIKDQIRDNQGNLNALPIVVSCTVEPINTCRHGWKKRFAPELLSFTIPLARMSIDKGLEV